MGRLSCSLAMNILPKLAAPRFKRHRSHLRREPAFSPTRARLSLVYCCRGSARLARTLIRLTPYGSPRLLYIPLSIFITCRWGDSNSRPMHYECIALPTEPHRHKIRISLNLRYFKGFNMFYKFRGKFMG